MKKPANKASMFILSGKFMVVLTIFAFIFLLLFSLSMNTPLARDEHQFIASGKLLQNHNLLPNINYTYFHMPYLVFIYALLFKFTSLPLIVARSFSVVCNLLILGLIFHTAFNLFQSSKYLIRLVIALGCLFILINNPLFLDASNLAWNHTPAALFAFFALTLCLSCYDYKTAEISVFFAGMMVGISIGIRLSFALMPLPFLVILFKNPLFKLLKDKLKLISLFCLGLFLAMIPVIMFFYFSKENFIFSNLIYPGLNTIFQQEAGHSQAMTVLGRLRYFKDVIVQPCNFFLLISFFIYVLAAFLKKNSKFHYKFEISSVLLLLPFLLAGSFAPTHSWHQYLYPLIPFLVLGILYSMKTLFDTLRDKIFILILFFLILAHINLNGRFHLNALIPGIKKASLASSWETTKIHNQSKKIREIVKGGKILTLAPVYSLETDNKIYKEFATGPFAYRVGHLLSKQQRKKYHIISPEELFTFLKAEKPKGILVGFEGHLEKPLIHFAQSNDYEEIPLSDDITLYIPSSD